ncbi:MAG: hypothetical protein R3C05_05130 [Pirellulaceae bacterium]
MTITLSLDDGTRQSFNRNEVRIGTGTDCDFAVPAIEGIRTQHAIIRRIAGRYLIESCGEWMLSKWQHSSDTRLWIQSGDLIDLASRGPTLRVDIDAAVDHPQAAPAAFPASTTATVATTEKSSFVPLRPATSPSPKPPIVKATPAKIDRADEPQAEPARPDARIRENGNEKISRRLRRRRRSQTLFFVVETVKLIAGGIVGIGLSYYIICHFVPDSVLLKIIAKELPASLQPEVIRGDRDAP